MLGAEWEITTKNEHGCFGWMHADCLYGLSFALLANQQLGKMFVNEFVNSVQSSTGVDVMPDSGLK